jgi:ABC-type transport system involved in cytochrome bd biosynthesis fused ATPase/permease subunit
MATTTFAQTFARLLSHRGGLTRALLAVGLERALLQNAEVVMLDESLGALDPENFQQCLDCVTRRAKTLLKVAHP